jgi:hypothetical protein
MHIFTMRGLEFIGIESLGTGGHLKRPSVM